MEDKLATKDKEIVVETVTTLPEEENDVHESFYNMTSHQITQIIEEGIVEEPPSLPQALIKDGKKRYHAVLADLDRLKDRLGGSSMFKNGPPSMDDEDSNKTFLGIPMPAVKDWFRKTLKDNWSPKFFWSKVASFFGVTKNDMSQYEDVYIRIQRFGMLIENREYFQDILDRGEENHYGDLCKITGLAWHPTLNGPGTEKEYMSFIDQILTEYYEEAQKKGDDALIEYFNAFEGVCFEDRARKLEEYAIKHPLSKNAEFFAEISQVADWDTTQTFEYVCEQEIMKLGLELDDIPTESQFTEHLKKKNIFETEFTTSDGTKAKPTEEQFEKWKEEAINILCILEKDSGLSLS